jgi:hypothetical protein
MKKFIIILIILVSASYGQNTGVPGKDFFPYMSFWDFAVYSKHVRQAHNCNSQDYVDIMLTRSFYYPLLVDLGLTNIVSDFGFIKSKPSLDSTYGNIKFLDMDFGWAGNDTGKFDPGRYVKATGNNPDNFSHQIGGDWDMTWNPDQKNYGFGTTEKSSRWAMDTSKQPAVSPTLTGDNTTDVVPPIISEESQVRYASIEDNHTPGGTIFFGNIDAGHFPHTDTTYQLSFFIRGDSTELERMDARVVVLQIYVIPGDALYTKPYNSNMTIKEPNLTEGIETNFLSAAYEVTAGELQDSAGTYRWITTPAFKVPGDTNIAYYAVWTGEATIYCDRMIMFNEFYDRMFNPTLKSNPIAPPDFGTQITSKYNGSNPALHSMYVDEPSLLAAEAFSHINDLVWSTLNGGSTAMELNGAIGPHAEWGMRFDQQYGKSAVDNTYKRKYLLYNVYPFRQEFDTTQSDVQAALEELINFRFIGDDATKHPYQYLGLRPAIRAAKKFDDQLTEDIPLIYILQVHAEHIVYNSGRLFSIVPNATSMRRAPTRDEIFVQGNMALAY